MNQDKNKPKSSGNLLGILGEGLDQEAIFEEAIKQKVQILEQNGKPTEVVIKPKAIVNSLIFIKK